jgi:CRP-like cAMP-binding protein
MDLELFFKEHKTGEYFGDLEVILSMPRKYSAKAIENLDALTLTRG